jgi:hypothetical protein
VLARWIPVPLLLLLPLVGRVGLALARRATRDERLARFLAPAAAVATWLLGIHVVGLVTGSFYVALFFATIALAAAGLVSMRAPSAPLDPPSSTNRWMWVGMVVAVALLVGPELNYSKHDECLLTGHLSIPAAIQNGAYPPHHLSFPAYELRYHYGIDLLDAVVSSLLGRADVHATVHVVVLVLWGYSFCLYWLLGERLLGGKAGGPVTAWCVLFAGGAPYWCRPTTPHVEYFTSMCTKAGTWITPPFVSNFLQHPWTLGMPVFGAILLLTTHLATARRTESPGAPWSSWSWVLLSLLTAMLSLAQVVLWVCFVPAFVIAGALEGRRLAIPKLARLVAWAAAMALVARAMHGMFAPSGEPSAGGIEFHPFWRDGTWREWLGWHLDAYGLLIPLAAAGLYVLRSQRTLLATLAVGGLLVRNLFRYNPSWNIVKFAMVSQIALAILASAVLAAALERPKWRFAGAAGIVLCTFFGVAWPVALTLAPPVHDCVPPPPAGADASAIDYLRRHVRAGEGVFRTEHADLYAIYGGLAQPTSDWGTESFGFRRSLFDDRRRLLAHPEASDAYLAQGFRWIVLGPGDGPRARQTAERWVHEGQAERAADFPPLMIYRLR